MVGGLRNRKLSFFRGAENLLQKPGFAGKV